MAKVISIGIASSVVAAANLITNTTATGVFRTAAAKIARYLGDSDA